METTLFYTFEGTNPIVYYFNMFGLGTESSGRKILGMLFRSISF